MAIEGARNKGASTVETFGTGGGGGGGDDVDDSRAVKLTEFVKGIV